MSAVVGFLRPEAWPVLLLVPAAGFLLWRLDLRRLRRALLVFGARAPRLASGPTAGRLRLRLALSVGALLLAALAVLEPAWGEGSRTAEQRGVDILVCLDVSRSMLARDIAPSRLGAAQREIRALAETVTGDRLGLVVFAGDARLMAPLTQDRDTFAALVDLADPEAVGVGGTDLGAALTAALEALAGATGDHEVVLLLTDGEDLEGRGARVAQTCREAGITVHCIGFGSPRGAKITLGGEGGESFLRDGTGRDVVSAMDPASLRRIAEVTGGTFVEAGGAGRPLVDLHEDRILPMARKALETEGTLERENRFQWVLLPAFLLWVTGLALSDRRGRTVAPRRERSRVARESNGADA